MATRALSQQSEHDAAISAAGQIYIEKGKHVWLNPNGEKNKSWNGRYIDVIAADSSTADKAWVIEVESADSVSETEAKEQWEDYDQVYTPKWYLAVPVDTEEKAKGLLQKHHIAHCNVITWQQNANGTHTFWGLPGLS